MRVVDFSHRLILWYRHNKRDLPWRSTRDPYRIWLSEVILQQTRVDQGMPYYYKFIEKFPDIGSLARASEKEVLICWQGLGYYSRARNLHRCAKIVFEALGGVFPKTFKELLKLPGIGHYTAAAIASFAYRQKVAAIDGNVYRVLSRIFGIKTDITTTAGKQLFQKTADELIPDDFPDDFNQAMMEFGALNCIPKKPACTNCIFAPECYASKHDLQNELPVKTKKTKVRKRYFQYIVYQFGDRLWMKERRGKGIWQGLYDFHLIESDTPLSVTDTADSEDLQQVWEITESFDKSNSYKHILSHQQIFATFFMCVLKKPLQKNYCSKNHLASFSKEQLINLPKPVLISAFLNDNFF